MDTAPGAIASARPGFMVGARPAPRLDAGLVRLVCGENEAGLSHCEAEFSNWGEHQGATGFIWFDRGTLDFGRDFALTIGSVTVFDGRVMAIEGRFPAQAPPTVVVRAEDRLQDLRMTRRTRCFERMRDADIVRRIAGDHGMSADTDLDTPACAVVTQINQSDLAFLRQRALLADADVWIEGKTLFVHRRGARTRAGLELVHGARLRQFTVAADLAHQRTAVVCGGWDVGAKSAIAAEAGAATLAGETSAGLGGPDVLRQALGERKDAVAHCVPCDEAIARGIAAAHLRAMARRFVRGRGTADADARVHVGRRITLSGLGPLFSGAYDVVESCHRFDTAVGLRSEFVVERPWIGRT
jgi:phage protein D